MGKCQVMLKTKAMAHTIADNNNICRNGSLFYLEGNPWAIGSNELLNLMLPHMNVPQGYITRGHSLKLHKPSVKTSIRQNCFSQRVIANWNSLPQDVVLAPTLNCFKNRLDKHWANNPIRFRWDACC